MGLSLERPTTHEPALASRVKRALTEFLLVPLAMVLGALLMAVAVAYVDHHQPRWLTDWLEPFRDLYFTDAEDTSGFLGTLTSALFGVTAITFSVLLIALQQSSSLIGAQVVNAFVARTQNQVLLGWLLGATLFVTMVWAASDDQTNLVLGATLSLVVAVLTVFTLAVLFYSVINQTRPRAVIDDIRARTLISRELMAPLLERTLAKPQLEDEGFVIRTVVQGYTKNIKLDALAKALPEGAEFDVAFEIGDFVAYSDPLGILRGVTRDQADEAADAIRNAIETDVQRTINRDPNAGVGSLRAIAWTTGSSAINNLAIAADAVHAMGDILCNWILLPPRETSGDVPIVYRDTTVEKALNAFECTGIIVGEGVQPETFALVFFRLGRAYELARPHDQDLIADIVPRLLTAMGDHVLSRFLEEECRRLAEVFDGTRHAQVGQQVRAASALMKAIEGELSSRGTRSSDARGRT